MGRHRQAQSSKSTGRGSRIASVILLVMSLLLLAYPIVSTILADYNNYETARRYAEESTKSVTPETREELMRSAKEYNAELWSADHPVRQDDPADPKYQRYLSLLKASEHSNTMARIQIPDVGIDLPVYHGTSDEVLYRGAGHMYNSDLPIGGDSNTSVITAHTGMVNASMFDNLNQLQDGEAVYISVLGETLRYRMTGYEVVKPEDYDAVTYEEGVDKLILITCTPYGINSDRLLVTAVRDDAPIAETELPEGWKLQLSWWMKIDLTIISLIILIAAYSMYRRRKNQNVESFQEVS